MASNFMVILLLLAVSTTFTKYVYVPQILYWEDAKTNCRKYYTDLAPIRNKYDTSLLQKLNINTNILIWIGMKKDAAIGKWMWSGGRQVPEFFWASTEPNNYGGIECYGAVKNYSWYDAPPSYILPSFCYKVYAVRERKTWEEALQYCRKHYGDVASVASETEMMLMQNELSKGLSTEHVWIGLQFLGGDWQWVDGQPFGYEAWGQEGRSMCPAVDQGCGALQVMGKYVTNVNLYEVMDVTVWNARNCDDSLYFLCY